MQATENKVDTNSWWEFLMRKIRTSGFKDQHQLEKFTIVEWKFTIQEYKYVVQQTRPMVTKSSEENKFGRQIATFNEEIKIHHQILKNT